MRLAKAVFSVKIEWVVGLRRKLRDSEAGCVGEVVAVADDELVEGVARA